MAGGGRVGRRFVVSGRVQGVGFRAFVERSALRLGVGGWVRNLADGRVEVEAFGTPTAVRALGDAVRSGPRWSRVDSVAESEISDELDDAISFHIR